MLRSSPPIRTQGNDFDTPATGAPLIYLLVHTFVRLSLLQAFQNAIFACSVISIGTYLLQTLHFSGREVGMIYATNAVAATITPPLAGWLADRRFSADRLLVVLCLLSALALTGCYFATSFVVFYGFFLLYNLCYMPTFGLLSAVCFHQLDDPAEQFPGVRVWGTVSFMLVGLGLSFFELEPTPIPLLAAAALAVGMAITCWFIPRIPPQPGFDWRTLRSPEIRRIFQQPGMIVLLIALFLSTFPSAFYYSFVNPFLNEIGWSAAAARMSLGQLLEVGVILAMPLVFRHLRFRQIVFWGLLLWGLRYFAFAYGRPEANTWLLYLGIMVQGVAFAWTVIAAQIYVDNRVPTSLRSTAQGLVGFTNQGLGVFLGSWLAGEVVLANSLPAGGHDWQAIWLIPGSVGVLAALFFWWWFPKKDALRNA